MKCTGSLSFEFSSAPEARKALKALGKGAPGTKRADVKAFVKSNKVVVEVSATDSVALRAVMNSQLRNMKILEELNGV